jgi:uroporphyrinogen decarboxylase
MKSRERILATLEHRTVDNIPYDLGGTDCSSIHVLAYQRLRARLGLPLQPIRCGCLTQLVARPDEDFMDAIGADAESIWFEAEESKTWKTPFGLELIVPARFDVQDLPDGSSVVRDSSGKVCAKRAAGAYYFDPVAPPLAEIKSADELDKFDALFERWDYPAVYDETLESLGARARRQYASTDRAVIGLWRMHYLQSAQLMRGFESCFMDLAADKDLAHAIMQKLHFVYLKRIDAFLEAFGDALDIVFLTDDLGSQKGGQISLATYEEMIYPYASEIVGKIKAAGKKVLMHSCGAISAYIPYLTEMGVDAINPVQVSAAGMNPRELVKQFGKDITFWGGGCNTQGALNSPDLDLVRQDVRRRLDEFGPDASLVFTQVHNIQYDVPPENILAMRDEFLTQSRKKS